MKASITVYIIPVALAIMLVAIPLLGTGCEEEQVQPPAQVPRINLSATLVPNTDLAVYAYFQQEKPTTLPADLTGMPSDVVVESLALWGIPAEEDFAFGGSLTLDSADSAADIHAMISSHTGLWTKLSGQTLYFVRGSGLVADTLKTAIDGNDFKYYDDQKALQEAALLPDGGTARLAAIAIARPQQELGKLLMEHTVPKAAIMMNALIALASLQVIAAGLYAPQPIDLADISLRLDEGTIWESELGILAVVKSGYPGFVVSPIVREFLDDAGYAETSLGELTVYKGTLSYGEDINVPIIIRVEGNRLFVAISGKESYAETLITGIKMP